MPKSESLSSGVRTAVVVTLVLSWLAMLASAQGQPSTPPRISWKTGREKDRALNAVLNVRWSSNPLRRAIGNLSRSLQVAIFLDRRVDPDQKVTFTAQAMTARQFLDALTERLGQDVSHIGPVVYIGPKETAAVLATVTELRHEEALSQPALARGRLRRVVPVKWPELTTPKELIEGFATHVGMKVDGIEQLPHDLWPEVDLPPLTFAQRMSLALAGFHLTFRYSAGGSAVRLEPLPESPRVTRSYHLPSGQGSISGLARRFPNASIEMESGRVTVIGTIEDQEAFKRLLEGKPEGPTPGKTPAGGRTDYTLRIENQPAGGVAQAIAKDIGLEIEFDPRTTGKLNELISFEVNKVSLDKLLDAVFSPVGLSYELTGKTVRVLPGDSQ